MGEYFQRSSDFVIGFLVYIATIYAKSEIILYKKIPQHFQNLSIKTVLATVLRF